MSQKRLKEIELLFRVSKELSISELLEKSDIPRATLKRYINRLIDTNIIEAYGKGRGRYYKLKKQIEDERVAVLKSGLLVGYLSYQNGRYSFEYEQGYKGKRLDGFMGNEIFYSFTLFPIFENLIPESDRRDSYLAKNKNLVEILLELENTHGDFDFVAVDKLYIYHRDYRNRKNWIDVKEKILEKQEFPNILDVSIDIDRAILEAKGKYSSLSGYQNKIDINIDFKTKKYLYYQYR
ncbi:MAG: hypothetical protein GXO60_05125 [Epsilonproteobacteria bacterium]|nr:hypothetical protein [Campylobacterota bacterium]